MIRLAVANQVAQLPRMIRGGGLVVTGTDSPIANTAVSTHLNMRAMVLYGLTPYEVLSSATRAAGEFLDEPLGLLRPGAYADIAILGSDPLADITAAADVRQVMANGVLHTVDDLLAPFAGADRRTTAPVSTRLLERIPDHPSTSPFWWHDPHYVEEARRSCCTGS